MQSAVIIMSKVPLPGKTKTRLMEKLTGEECAAFHLACLRDILAEVKTLGLRCYLYYTGGSPEDFLASLPLDLDFLEMRPQRGADLGERMYNACLEVLAQHDRVVIIGTDLPDITAQIILQALQELESSSLVLGPAQDGGYYLLGLKKAHGFLFTDIAWGTSRVLGQTLEKAEAFKLKTSLLPEKRDIDTWEDLVHFYEKGLQGQNGLFKDKQAYSMAVRLITKLRK